MAKKNRYRKGGPARLDMRKGGRVALQRGGPRRGINEEERRIREAAAPVDPSRTEPTSAPNIPQQPWTVDPVDPGPVTDPVRPPVPLPPTVGPGGPVVDPVRPTVPLTPTVGPGGTIVDPGRPIPPDPIVAPVDPPAPVAPPPPPPSPPKELEDIQPPVPFGPGHPLWDPVREPPPAPAPAPEPAPAPAPEQAPAPAPTPTAEVIDPGPVYSEEDPYDTGSSLGQWLSEEGNSNRNLYNIEGDRSSGYLMDIFWVDPTNGQIGFTDEGWSRVPGESHNLVFRTQDEAIEFLEGRARWQETGSSQVATEPSEGESNEWWEWNEESGKHLPTPAMIDLQRDKGYLWDSTSGTFIKPDIGFGQDTGLTPEQIKEREERYARSAEGLEAAARGEGLPAGAVIDPETGVYKVPEGEAGTYETMDPTYRPDAETAQLPTVGEQVGTGTAVTAAAPREVTADTYTAKEVTEAEAPIIDDVTGNVSSQAVANMQTQAMTLAATGVDVDTQQAAGALADRVVGTFRPEAIATAVSVTGTNLPKVLRAKKQLRRAGLSEEMIAEIGNNPADLEARLMDFTEVERGMIEGLPNEALVSTQLDNLLSGLQDGNIPQWANPAVAAVNQIMAERGLDASTVGRDALFNAIVQTAMPMAQSNATSIKESVLQQRDIEAQASRLDAQLGTQTAISNADNVFDLDLAQFSSDVQRELSNKKFLQTVTLTDTDNEQKATLQNAASMAQLDVAQLDSNTRLAAQNAQSFLAMDMSNLDRRQQSEVLRGQQHQQRLLSNQSATNAAEQFNSSSQMQTDQFMANLAAQTDQYNKTQLNTMEQFNTQQENAAEARRVANETDVEKFNAQMKNTINEFNAKQDFAREQFNTTSANQILQADLKWRRDISTLDTAAKNAVVQFNAQNAFQLSTQAQAFMWQELRDQADYAFRTYDNYEQRKASMYIAMLGNESDNYEEADWETRMKAVTSLFDGFLEGGG